MKDSHYWDLIARHLAGKTLPAEEKALRMWINERSENAEAYELQRTLWNHTGTEDPQFYSKEDPLYFKTEKRWVELSAHMKEQGDISSRRISFTLILKIAASLLIIVISGFVFHRFMSTEENLIVIRSTDHTIEIVLPDNSKVWLNKNSLIKYPRVFSDNYRDVSLTGEAFFDVSKNKEKPFRVTAESTQIEVLGTSFNVRCQRNEKAISVVVVTGKVAFYPRNAADKKVILLPGNAGVFNKGKSAIEVVSTADSNMLTWRSGVLTFKNARMKDVMNHLQQYYGHIVISKNPALSECKINTQFDNEPLEKVLKEIRLLLDIQYSIHGDTVLLSGGNCN